MKTKFSLTEAYDNQTALDIVLAECNSNNTLVRRKERYCKTRIFSIQFILALLEHSFHCAKISSALNFHILYVLKICGKPTEPQDHLIL